MPEVLQTDSHVIHLRFPFEFHAPQSHAYPTVQTAVPIAAVGPRRREIIRGASDDAVQLLDHFSVQVVAASGDPANFGLEVLHRLGSHPHELRLDVEAQKGEPFVEPRHFRLFGTQGELEHMGGHYYFDCLS